MDEIRRLENQIRELQEELQRQNMQAARMRQQLADENLRKLRDYQAEMQTNLNRHDKEVQKEYDRLLKEYQDSVNLELREQQLKMNDEYQKLLRGTQAKEREWQEKTKQLQQLIDELKKSGIEKEQVSGQEARKYIEESMRAYKNVEKKPHEKFFPKRLGNYYNAIREARTMYESGLNEAAIAISISAKSGVNRLGYDVDDEFSEWKRQYFILKNKVGSLHLKLNDEIVIWGEFSGNPTGRKEEKIIGQKAVNFWSKGEYGTICNRLAQIGKEIGIAESDGMENYLKKEKSMSRDDIKKYIDEVDEMEKQFENQQILYKSQYEASCERADWGERIIDFFTDEINLEWVESESHFRIPDENILKSSDYQEYMVSLFGEDYEKADMRQWLELVFENASDTKIFIYLVPNEKGNKVENRIVLYIDYAGASNEEYSRQIYLHICESIGLEEDGIISYAADVSDLKNNANRTLRDTGKSIEKKILKMK
ncbi:MAG: hypothetical protein II919_04370 [Lachnospiraceae bacterium]|nr:hypothetical protein [Lachnospiraceae bacterium]